MEYAVINEDHGGLKYLILIEKGYYHQRAFNCLARIRDDFTKHFDRNYALKSKPHGLSKDFEEAFEKIQVSIQSNEIGGVFEANNRQDSGGARLDVQYEDPNSKNKRETDNERR